MIQQTPIPITGGVGLMSVPPETLLLHGARDGPVANIEETT
jgi:hypothetical protein